MFDNGKRGTSGSSKTRLLFRYRVSMFLKMFLNTGEIVRGDRKYNRNKCINLCGSRLGEWSISQEVHNEK